MLISHKVHIEIDTLITMVHESINTLLKEHSIKQLESLKDFHDNSITCAERLLREINHPNRS